jgi:hypothetical protein
MDSLASKANVLTKRPVSERSGKFAVLQQRLPPDGQT